MAYELTQEQRAIVDDRGGELLVSAAAGSGKTRVLVSRILDRVEQEKWDIHRFLVITYTKAAAGELHTRIVEELNARLAADPGNRHLRRQVMLVYQAQVSTIHSFCSALLKQNAHLLEEMDGGFRLCEEDEAQLLKERVLDDLLEKEYENIGQNPAFAELADTLGAGRDDRNLAQIVLDIHGRVQSHADPEDWLKRQMENWNVESIRDLSQTGWGSWMMGEMKRRCSWCRNALEQAVGEAQKDELLLQNYAGQMAEPIDRLSALLGADSWQDMARLVPIPFPEAGRKRARKILLSDEEALLAQERAEWVKLTRKRCKDMLKKAEVPFLMSAEEQLEEIGLQSGVMQELLGLVVRFQNAFSREKRRRRLLDFSDLEHLALKLLVDGEGKPSTLARECSEYFAEVLVDEYQDTNQIQNAIFRAVSDEGRKLVEVGDVKQSIYRFRLADPTVFLKKYAQFPDGESADPGMPRKRLMSRNFRSRAAILEGCNDLFRNIMSVELGELEYGVDQELVPDGKFPEWDGDALELDLLDLSFLQEQEKEERDDKTLLEARFAARRIRQMLHSGMQVTEKEKQRPLRASDVMILLRSPGPVLRHYVQALEEEGLAWNAEGGEDLFRTTEVNVAMAMLQIVDNPRQDVPLLSALRSPLFGFTADQLAMLRSKSEGDFYTAMLEAEKDGDSACAAVLELLRDLRFTALDKTARQLVWYIYEKTNMLGIFGAMDLGRERQGNLLALYNLVGRLEGEDCCSLFQILTRLERFRQNGKIRSGKGTGAEGVSILSIHRSKGLEKPVVLLCGMMKQFNREDLKQRVLFHPELGVGPKGFDRERRIEYDTLARQAVAGKLEQEHLSEEMRLLYVAMTRAKEKLIMTFGLTEGRRVEQRLEPDAKMPVEPIILAQQRSVGDWILLYAKARKGDWPDINWDPNRSNRWDIRWYDGEELTNSKRKVHPKETEAVQDEVCAVELAEKLTREYPYRSSTCLISKLTATQLKGRLRDTEVAQQARNDPKQPEQAPVYLLHEMDDRSERARLKGTAIHQAMQYIPLEGNHGVEDVERYLDEMVEMEMLSRQQREDICAQHIAEFFQSKPGRAMCDSGRVMREFKFSLLVPASRYWDIPRNAEEQVLLQGVVDAWYEEAEGITVIDFKSDRIRPGQENLRAQQYRHQLQSYSDALQEILQTPVKRKIVWFFETGTMAEL